ncbi:MAG: hypothetical protein IJY59_08090 [Bacteroidaceae bacterium]|nr:hypothetical protein [Bacteroidaceae bacterium]
MKKYIYSLFAVLLATATMTSCTEDEGTVPGNDTNPSVVMYQYTSKKPYNEDNDVTLRLAFNNQVESAYYLAEKASEKESRVASLGEEGYLDYVVSNGTKVSDVTADADVVITGLFGKYAITAVAVNGTKKASATSEFTGLEWEDVVTGTYYFQVRPDVAGMETNATTLQVCTTDATLYRFKDVFGADSHMKIQLLPDYTATDADGTYTYFRIPATTTPFTYGNYGAVSVRDVGYWQGSSAWVTDNGYESGMYEDYSCFLMIQYYVSAGNLGYDYDYFIPDAE